MRLLIFLSVFSLFLFSLSCSNGSKTPTTPLPEEQPADSSPTIEFSESQMLLSGTLNLEDGSLTTNERNAEGYMDVTSYVGSFFSYQILGFAAPEVLELNLKLINPTAITAYDVIIVFDELYGKYVVNPDAFIDIYMPLDIDPFIAFMKLVGNRQFDPSAEDNQLLQITYGPGDNPFVDFFIIAHLPGNTGGVLSMTPPFITAGAITSDGGTGTVSIGVSDHQEDVTSVEMETLEITGGWTSFTQSPTYSDVWEAEVTNHLHAPPGDYFGTMVATSPSTPEYSTYNYGYLTVVEPVNLFCMISTLPDPPSVWQGEPINFDASASSGDYPIVSYEWDIDYQFSGTFDVDLTGSSIDTTICRPGQSLVALRVTDSQNNSQICTTEINVVEDYLPIVGWGADDYLIGVPYEPHVGHQGVFAHDNSVYTVFTSTADLGKSDNLYFITSDDNGSGWGPPVQITNFIDPLIVRMNIAGIRMDKSNKDLYVVFNMTTAEIGGQFYTYITKSSDSGQTWSSHFQINNGNHDTFMPTLALDSSTQPSSLYVVDCIYDLTFGDYQIVLSRSDAGNVSSWSTSQVSDMGTMDNVLVSLAISPVDKSLNIAWTDSTFISGTGTMYFDRSVNSGVSWGSDVLIFNDPIAPYGPFVPVIGVNPTTGIPGLAYLAWDNSAQDFYYMFRNAASTDGSSWNSPVNITQCVAWINPDLNLSATAPGHWSILCRQNDDINFLDSTDNGMTWANNTVINDSGNSVWNQSMYVDECNNAQVVYAAAEPPYHNFELYHDWGS